MNIIEYKIKTITLWFILLFNRNKSYLKDMRQTNYSTWLTGYGYSLRLNYTEPGGGGSTPVRKIGLFEYETYIWPGGNKSKEIICGSAVDEVEIWCKPIWMNFIKSVWSLGSRETIR